MRALGDKASARRVAIAAGVPVIPATEVLGDDMEAIKTEAEEIGFPLMLKASWGGGGRGMRPILNAKELPEKVMEGRREAEAAFGNGEGYLEKMITRAPMSRCKSSATSMAACITSLSAIVRCSAATKRSWSAPLPPISPTRNARKFASLATRSASTSIMNAPGPSNS